MNKKITILSAPSGAGKSTLAKKIQKETNAVICSTDDFFMESGVYKFDKTKLYANHLKNQSKVKELMKNGYGHIIVDNTNLVHKERKVYLELAKEYSYEVEIVYLDFDVEECIKRNVHNVPEETIRMMAKRMTKEL